MGYMLSDNRVSGGVLEEHDTVSCKHCQAILRIIKRQKEGYWCGTCAGHVCRRCASRGRCEPFFRQVEHHLAQERSLRSMGFA